MSNDDNWVGVSVKETESIIVVRRIRLTMRNPQEFSVDPSPENTIGYYAECRAHGTIVNISELQAECVEDSIAFCKKCLNDEPAIQKKPDPIVDALRRQLAGAQCSKPDTENRKRWHVGKAFVRFIENADLDL